MQGNKALKKSTLLGTAKSVVYKTPFIPVKFKINNDIYRNIKLCMSD